MHPKQKKGSSLGNYKSRINALAFLMLVTISETFAQGSVAGKLTTFLAQFKSIINIVFMIGILYGLVRVVFAFLGVNKEHGLSSFLWLLVAIIIWGTINYFLRDFGGGGRLEIDGI